MAGGRAVTEYDSADVSNFIDLKQFPPVLRKLGKHLLESSDPITVSDACEKLKLNINSIYATISRCKKNGNDFMEFIDQQAKSILHVNKVAVLSSVVEGAVSRSSTSHNQQKLYFQLTGDLRESDININIGTLTVGVNVAALPVSDNRDKGIIDIEPFIPKGK